jgi:pimeloyl-ACP methyl ester carboxylesterase
MLPFVIHEAYQDNWAPLMAWGKMGEGTFETIPIGLYLSIVCAEDIPRIERMSAFENQMGGDSISSLKEMCSVWKPATIDATFFEPVSSNIPILLLSGENDPVTPPKNGEQALQTLSNAKHIIVPGVAHNTLQTECMLNIMRRFVETAEPEGIETSCVSKQKRPPFVISTAGTMP